MTGTLEGRPVCPRCGVEYVGERCPDCEREAAGDANAEAVRQAAIERLGEADDELRKLWRELDERLGSIMRKVGEAQRALIFDDVDEITGDDE